MDENINLLLPHELVILNKYDFTHPKDVKDKPSYKYLRVNMLIFDDLVSDSNAFKRGHSALNHLCITHRHLQCNLIFASLPKRRNETAEASQKNLWADGFQF